MSLTVRFSIVAALIVIAAAAGLYLGRISVNDEPTGAIRTGQTAAPTPRAAESEPMALRDEAQGDDPPLYLHVGRADEDVWNIVGEQVALAANAGVHRCIIPLALRWGEEDRAATAQYYNSILERYLAWNRHGRFLLQVNLNPPPRWFEAHPDAAMRVNNALQAYPSPTSRTWHDAARDALELLIVSVESGPYREHVLGYVLGALIDQRWMLPNYHDESRTNREGFAKWLRAFYGSETALRNAWAVPEINFEDATIPTRPDTTDIGRVFLSLPDEQSMADFLRYSSESVANTLAGFAALTARVSTITPMIGAFYGFSFETTANGAGHFALTALLESDLNTLVSPVSYVDRGLGGVGGMMGAVDSWTMRGKQWLILDDTRTGVERDSETNAFSRIKGLRAEDVFEVQRRNFAKALTYGLGLVWSDPRAEGWLYDIEQWRHLGRLRDIYARRVNDGPALPDTFPETVLTVVVDEESRFYQQCETPANQAFLVKARDAVLRAGVSARFHLLRDVIEDRTPPTSVYLFLNAFHLTEEDRARLHSRLAREEAAVIWVYAPGYIADRPDANNIALTTGMDVRVFEAPRSSASLYLLAGHFLQSEERFGSDEYWGPLFYIAPEENTDFLARYVDEEEKGSAAILTLPEGWTSVYIATPTLTPALLCEILRLLEQHIFLTPVERPYYDAVFARDDLIALHASQAGKRSLAFGYFCDSEDLIDPGIGWLQKETVMLTVRTGETRLLQHRPIQAGAQ